MNKKYLLLILSIGIFFSGISALEARDTDPNYRFAGIKAPESPFKNTWGAFQTDIFSGSFSYNFNIDVPAGTAGLAPKITLSYNSHSAKSPPGWLGMGWDIPLSYIQRDIEYTRKDVSDDTFDLYLDGAKHDLVFVPADSRYHTKIESFMKIEKLSGAPNERGEYWLVTAKNGMQFRFGYNADAEHIVASTDPNMTNRYVWRWSLDQVTDPNGNSIFYHYTEIPNNGEAYLTRIEYNNERKRAVDFILSDRVDPYDPTEMVGGYLYVDQGSEIIGTRKLGEIRTSVNGQLVKKYVLTYKRNEPENRLLLTSITQYGSDGTTPLPPVKFDYKAMKKDFNKESWRATSTDKYVRKLEKDGDLYYDIIDMDGDGRPDYVNYDADDKYWKVYRNKGTSFSSSRNIWDTSNDLKYIQDVREEKGKATNTRSSMMDFNRDGYTDIVWADGEDDHKFKYALNNGTGFDPMTVLIMPTKTWIREAEKVKYDSKGKPKNAPNVFKALFDINGDGLPDIVKRSSVNGGENNAWKIYRNKGNYFEEYDTWQVYHKDAYIEILEKDDQDVRMTTADMNGDGLVDIIWGESSSKWRVFYNTGSHFRESFPGVNWNANKPGDDDIVEIDDHDDDNKANDTKRILLDLNGDGLPDIIEARDDLGENWYVYFNRGNRFLERVKWYFEYSNDYVRDVTFDGKDRTCVKRDLLDMNGDGLPDIVKSSSGKDWEVCFNEAVAADLMVKVTDTLGATIAVDYTSSMDFTHTRLPFNYWVVKNLSTDNGVSGPHRNISASSFSYGAGLYDFPAREFRGFGKVTETRADGTLIHHYFLQDEARKGKEYRTEINSAAGDPFARTENMWNSQLIREVTPSTDNVWFPRLDRTDDFTLDGVAENPKQVRTEFLDYDPYGNVQQEKRHGDLATPADDFTEFREFNHNTERWILDRIGHSRIADGNGATLREKWFTYDNNGNLEKEETWLDTGPNPVVRHTYDAYGNRETTTDPNEHMTRMEYDSLLHTFPVKIWNAKNQLMVRTYHPLYGQVESETDPNGYVTGFRYDALGRKTKEIRPYDSVLYPTVEIGYFIDGTAPEFVKTAKREVSGQSGTLDTYQIIDGFASLIQTRSDAENPSYQVVTDVYYDALGRVRSQSNPYLSPTVTGYGTPNTGISGSSYQYDAIGRPVTVANPDGTSVHRSFDHWSVTETDENTHATTYRFDAYQSLLQVTENNQGEKYHTLYNYNLLGELVGITDHLKNVTSISYDSLGRKIFMTDPDMGNWEYEYDRAGNLTRQEDANNVSTIMTYDEFNRKIKTDYLGDADIIYDYDLTTIGTLSKITDAAGTLSFSYDHRLRKTGETRQMDGKSWTTEWSYDAMDRVTSLTYPDGETVSMTYNSQGLLDSIPGIVPDLTYNANGQITQKQNANSLNTVYDYHPQNNRLTTLRTGSIQNFAYAYDNAGNIRSIRDDIAGLTESFSYDDLDRLTRAGDAGYNAEYRYNAIGNMVAEAMNGVTVEYKYANNAGPHAVTGKISSGAAVISFSINSDFLYTVVRNVNLTNSIFGVPTHYMASENSDFTGAVWQSYSKAPVFTLSEGFGDKTVYFKVKNENGESDARKDTIEYLLDTDGDSLPDKYDPDDDNDSMPDEWETLYGLNPLSAADADQDADGEGFTNAQEYKYGSNPTLTDTDDDGLNDYEEISKYQTDPANSDSDRDGVPDAEDISPIGTNQPPSGNQFMMLTGTLTAGGDHRQASAQTVQDSIGKISGQISVEQALTSLIGNIDSDGGTIALPDGSLTIVFPPNATPVMLTVTVIRSVTSPSANEGFQLLGDTYEISAVNAQGQSVTIFAKPLEITMIYDPTELGDIDEDDLRINYYDESTGRWIGLDSSLDLQANTVTAQTSHFTVFTVTGPVPVPDSDKDGLPDYWEMNYFETLEHDGSADSDNDGLTDMEEYLNNTNPNLFDTEEDGLGDAWEVAHSTHPLWDNPPEDLNISGDADLADVIIVLKICAGIPFDAEELRPNADISGDDKVGIEEAIRILQEISTPVQE